MLSNSKDRTLYNDEGYKISIISYKTKRMYIFQYQFRIITFADTLENFINELKRVNENSIVGIGGMIEKMEIRLHLRNKKNNYNKIIKELSKINTVEAKKSIKLVKEQIKAHC